MSAWILHFSVVESVSIPSFSCLWLLYCDAECKILCWLQRLFTRLYSLSCFIDNNYYHFFCNQMVVPSFRFVEHSNESSHYLNWPVFVAFDWSFFLFKKKESHNTEFVRVDYIRTLFLHKSHKKKRQNRKKRKIFTSINMNLKSVVKPLHLERLQPAGILISLCEGVPGNDGVVFILSPSVIST